MVHRVLPVLQDQFRQPTASSSPDTARVRKCHPVPMELALSMTDTRCCMCRVTRGRTDRTLVRRIFVSSLNLKTFFLHPYFIKYLTFCFVGPFFQARPAAVCAGSAPCPSCSAISTTSATSPPATTTPTGCPHPSPCPCPWPPSLERASSLTSAGRDGRTGDVKERSNGIE